MRNKRLIAWITACSMFAATAFHGYALGTDVLDAAMQNEAASTAVALSGDKVNNGVLEYTVKQEPVEYTKVPEETFISNKVTEKSRYLIKKFVAQSSDELAKVFPKTFSYFAKKGIQIGLGTSNNDNSNEVASVQLGSLSVKGNVSLEYTLMVNLGIIGKDPANNELTEEGTAYLRNSLAHEAMHMMMMEALTSGMAGNEANADLNGDPFPRWFQEGMATTIGGGARHVYRSLGFQTLEEFRKSETISKEKLKENLKKYNLKSARVPLVRPTNDFTYAAYGTGYLASLYLGHIIGGGLDTNAINEQVIVNGLDEMMYYIAEGYSLSDAIRILTKGKYQNVDDFENKFADDEGALNFITALATKMKHGEGSILNLDLEDSNPLKNVEQYVESNDHTFNVNDGYTRIRNIYTEGYITFKGGAEDKSGYDRNGWYIEGNKPEKGLPEAFNREPLPKPGVGQTPTQVKKSLTITDVSIQPKTYDGTKEAVVKEVSFSVDGTQDTLVKGQDYEATAEFNDPNAGKNKIVTVTVTLKGDAVNTYYLAGNQYALFDQTIAKKPTEKPMLNGSYAVSTTDPSKFVYTIENVENAQYSKDGGNTWQDTNVFDGIEPLSTHTFAVQIKETNNTLQSEKTSQEVVFNLLENPNTPNLSVTAQKTGENYTVMVEQVPEAEYTFGNDVWADTNTLQNVKPGTEVKVGIRYKKTPVYNESNAVYKTIKTFSDLQPAIPTPPAPPVEPEPVPPPVPPVPEPEPVPPTPVEPPIEPQPPVEPVPPAPVVPQETQIIITPAGANPVIYGDTVTYTVQVVTKDQARIGQIIPQILNVYLINTKDPINKTILGGFDDRTGSITFETSIFDAGEYLLQAEYLGDENFKASTAEIGVTISPKMLAWDTTNLKAESKQEGMATEVPVAGTLGLTGVIANDIVNLQPTAGYMTQGFAAQTIAGAYMVDVVANTPWILEGPDAQNYTLPAENPQVPATVVKKEEPHPVPPTPQPPVPEKPAEPTPPVTPPTPPAKPETPVVPPVQPQVPTPAPQPSTPTPTVPQPAVSGYDWYNLLNQLSGMKQGSLQANVGGENVLPAFILQAIYGKPITLTLTRGNENYVFNGEKLKAMKFAVDHNHNFADLTSFIAKKGSASSSKAPQTGDNTPVGVLISLATLSGITSVLLLDKKRKMK